MMQVIHVTSKPSGPYPVTCPLCEALAGFPYEASTQVGVDLIRVETRCRECRHEWTTEVLMASGARVPEDADCGSAGHLINPGGRHR